MPNFKAKVVKLVGLEGVKIDIPGPEITEEVNVTDIDDQEFQNTDFGVGCVLTLESVVSGKVNSFLLTFPDAKIMLAHILAKLALKGDPIAMPMLLKYREFLEHPDREV